MSSEDGTNATAMRRRCAVAFAWWTSWRCGALVLPFRPPHLVTVTVIDFEILSPRRNIVRRPERAFDFVVGRAAELAPGGGVRNRHCREQPLRVGMLRVFEHGS